MMKKKHLYTYFEEFSWDMLSYNRELKDQVQLLNTKLKRTLFYIV